MDGIAEIRIITCPQEMAGHRLDQTLARLASGCSRAFLQRLMDAGLVSLSDGSIPKPSYRVRGGEILRIAIPEAQPLEAKPEDLPLTVLFEDEHIVVIDKRPGMVAHPSPGHRDGTLVNALLHHYGDSLSGIGGVIRPGIVHRLDKDTTGCLVAAKHDEAHHRLIEQFMHRSVEKTYLAITDGVPKPLSGKVEGNIGRSRRDRKLHAMLSTGGRHSLTHYRTMENYGVLALVECELHTGRTHQARVHMAHAGSPVLCDKDYGRRELYTTADLSHAVSWYRYGRPAVDDGRPAKMLLSRQALHAWRLAFDHPITGDRIQAEAPIPADMLGVLAPLRKIRDEMGKGG